LTESYLHSDPILPEELSGCLSVLGIYLDDLAREVPEVAACERLVGVAGTVTTTAAVEIGLAEYDFDTLNGFVLTKAAVEDVFRTLATETIAQRLDNPGMYRGREDVIVGGLCVLVAVMRRFGFETCVVSERNLLDGAMARYVDTPVDASPGAAAR
jgi:exopolyphosphatase/guanosine-5'-triphosphate,3'-diphosphate pyrophosphatase